MVDSLCLAVNVVVYPGNAGHGRGSPVRGSPTKHHDIASCGLLGVQASEGMQNKFATKA